MSTILNNLKRIILKKKYADKTFHNYDRNFITTSLIFKKHKNNFKLNFIIVSTVQYFKIYFKFLVYFLVNFSEFVSKDDAFPRKAFFTMKILSFFLEINFIKNVTFESEISLKSPFSQSFYVSLCVVESTNKLIFQELHSNRVDP